MKTTSCTQTSLPTPISAQYIAFLWSQIKPELPATHWLLMNSMQFLVNLTHKDIPNHLKNWPCRKTHCFVTQKPILPPVLRLLKARWQSPTSCTIHTRKASPQMNLQGGCCVPFLPKIHTQPIYSTQRKTALFHTAANPSSRTGYRTYRKLQIAPAVLHTCRLYTNKVENVGNVGRAWINSYEKHPIAIGSFLVSQ